MLSLRPGIVSDRSTRDLTDWLRKDSAPPLRTRRLRGESVFGPEFHRRDAEYAEVALRKTVFPTDSSGLRVHEVGAFTRVSKQTMGWN